MKVTKNIDSADELRNYFRDRAWGGAVQRCEAIEEKSDYMQVWESIFNYIDECIGELDETGLNDVLWFDEFIQEIIYPEEYEEESDSEDDHE